MTRPDYTPLDPVMQHQHPRRPLYTTPPRQIAPSRLYTYEAVGSPFEDAPSPLLPREEPVAETSSSVRSGEARPEATVSSGGGADGLGLGFLGFESDESRIEKSSDEEQEQPAPRPAVMEERGFKDAKALIMASPNPDSAAFAITNPALHLRSLKRRVTRDASAFMSPTSPRGSPDMVARYIDPLSPIPIFAPSGPSSPVVPPSPNPSQTNVALSVVLALLVVGLLGGASLYFVKKKRRARELDQLAEIEALEKGQGGGKGPPLDVDHVSLWGKRLSHFERESKRLGDPPPAVPRDQRRLSAGRSEKAKSRLSQSHLPDLPVIVEVESDPDLVGRALNHELPMVQGVSELRLEGLGGRGSDEGRDPTVAEIQEDDAGIVAGARPISDLSSRRSSDLLLSAHLQQLPDVVEPVGPPNTPEQAVDDSQSGPLPSTFLAHLAESPLHGLHATPPLDAASRPSSVSSSIYTSSSSDTLSTAPTDSPSMSTTQVDSNASFFDPSSPVDGKHYSVDFPSPFSPTRPRSDSKSSSSVKSVKSVDLLKTAIGKRFQAGSKTFSLPPSPSPTPPTTSVFYTETRPRSQSDATIVIPALPPMLARRPSLTDPFSPSYTKVLVKGLSQPQQQAPSRRALISTFTPTSPSASVNQSSQPFGITIKPSLLTQHTIRMQQSKSKPTIPSPRPSTQYNDSPPSPSPAPGLNRAATLPASLPSCTRRTSFTSTLPPLHEDQGPVPVRPPVERAQSLPLPVPTTAPFSTRPTSTTTIPIISITDPYNLTHTHTPLSPSVSLETSSSFASSLEPAWEEDEGEEEEETYAYDYESHFAKGVGGEGMFVLGEEEDGEEGVGVEWKADLEGYESDEDGEEWAGGLDGFPRVPEGMPVCVGVGGVPF